MVVIFRIHNNPPRHEKRPRPQQKDLPGLGPDIQNTIENLEKMLLLNRDKRVLTGDVVEVDTIVAGGHGDV